MMLRARGRRGRGTSQPRDHLLKPSRPSAEGSLQSAGEPGFRLERSPGQELVCGDKGLRKDPAPAVLSFGGHALTDQRQAGGHSRQLPRGRGSGERQAGPEGNAAQEKEATPRLTGGSSARGPQGVRHEWKPDGVQDRRTKGAQEGMGTRNHRTLRVPAVRRGPASRTRL